VGDGWCGAGLEVLRFAQDDTSSRFLTLTDGQTYGTRGAYGGAGVTIGLIGGGGR
jgi:hypothetical protein